MPLSAVVEIRSLRKRFGSRQVLDGINLSFGQGQTTVVLGASGTGKSVLLKHIVGLLRPDEGEVRYRGTRIDQMSEKALAPIRREIGFLFQMSALFDSMTVRENIEFPLIEHTELDPEARKQRVRDALSMVDLKGVESRHPEELSGGQRKRVALARAIVLRPQLMLYDEPTTGLDPIRADGINDLIIKLKKDLGVTSIVVTHDLVSAEKISDTLVMLDEGKVIAQGTMDSLRDSRDERVRHFLSGQSRYGDGL